ncbi:hypothetical protein [Halorubrum sp. ARQ200]|uniref:hypothetical protein n=2 Tax=unclassified Halorubrum TaxID=2642239 RepID=UPI001138DB33|nr:hypothetical protein [Halorubrum sp. ARQ200]TKX44624.1 hypothetical protein EXE50_06110 [Halorubrum sp. ARQ200]
MGVKQNNTKQLDRLTTSMRLNRRKMLIGLGGVSASSGALMGTGAFTSVEAERTLSVETAGDASALLGLESTDKPNGEYTELTSEGTVEVTLDTVNKHAVTTVRDVFRVTNKGSQPAFVYIKDDSEKVQFSGFSRKGSPSTGLVKDSPISTLPGPRVIEGPENALRVPVGLSFRVDVEVDTTGSTTSQTLLETVTIVAQADPPAGSPFDD